MIQLHCFSLEQIDAVWRLLAQVPDADFLPCEVYVAGTFRYVVVRIDGEQTTAPAAGPPGCSCPAP